MVNDDRAARRRGRDVSSAAYPRSTVSITEDIEDFVSLHRSHGDLVGDATAPTLTGYRMTITCPCGLTFVRHVTASEAAGAFNELG
jgi:hypothetical protein